MTSDRRTRQRRHRLVEVMTVSEHDQANGDHSAAQIARLFDIAGRKDEALALLAGCVSQLREVQAAKEALTMLPAADLRAALEFRRRARGGELA